MVTNVRTSTSVFKTVNGLSLTIDVSIPEDFQQGTGIVLVLGEKTTFPPLWLIRACHRRGWAYATASYRLLPEASGLDILSDALDAVRWIHDHISKNIIIAGSSAGGYLALATAANPHAPRPLAVLSIYGMLDLASQRYVQPALEFSGFTVSDITASAEEITKAKTAGQLVLFPDLLTRIPGLAGRILQEGVEVIPEDVRAIFPATFGLDANFPPTALVHGDADVLVCFDQSAAVSQKLRSKGVSVLFEQVVGQGHGFDVRVPDDIDIDDPKAGDPPFYDNLRRILAYLESVCKERACA
ncbi:hypothetical protein VTN96DRAFT_5831 [Rasamsonia emersonii]